MILYNLLVDLTLSLDVSVNYFDIFFQGVQILRYMDRQLLVQYSQMKPVKDTVCLSITYSDPFCYRVTVLSD
jgi:hypothetical protein